MLRHAVKATFAKNVAKLRPPSSTSQFARSFATEGRTRTGNEAPEIPIPKVSPAEPECPQEVPKIDRSRPLPPPAYAASRLDKVPQSDQEEALHFKADPTENHPYESAEGQNSNHEAPKSADDIRAMNQSFHQEQQSFDHQFGSARFAADHQDPEYIHRDNRQQATDDLTNMSQREEHARDHDPSTWGPKDPRSGNDARQFSRDLEVDKRNQAAQARLGGRLPGQDRRDKITQRAEFDKQEIFGRDKPGTQGGTRERDLAKMRALGLIDEDQPEREIQDHAKRK